MTENLPEDGVQSRQAVAQRCCLNCPFLHAPMPRRESICTHDRASASERLREHGSSVTLVQTRVQRHAARSFLLFCNVLYKAAV